MMRYDIEETAVYEKVRTVVWEDGAASPLLPDPRPLAGDSFTAHRANAVTLPYRRARDSSHAYHGS